MGDNLSAADRRKTMQAVKGKGSRLEKRLFSMLVRMGVEGWKKNANSVIGKPDVAFTKQQVAIFIDGCFWHGCPYCNRKLPLTNREYWKRKIERNIILAKSYNKRLRADGWIVIRIWEHEINQNRDKQKIKIKIMRALNKRARNSNEKKLYSTSVVKTQALK